MLYTLICNGMRKEAKSIWWGQGGECWIDLSTNGPNGPLGPWFASGPGTPSPLEGWWAPVAQHYKREWGPQAQTTRFAAATVAPTPQTLTVPEGRAEAMGSLTSVSTGNCRRPCLHRSSLPSAEHHRQNQRCEHGLEVWFTQCSPTRSTPRWSEGYFIPILGPLDQQIK
jgi:hypothetical protein